MSCTSVNAMRGVRTHQTYPQGAARSRTHTEAVAEVNEAGSTNTRNGTNRTNGTVVFRR